MKRQLITLIGGGLFAFPGIALPTEILLTTNDAGNARILRFDAATGAPLGQFFGGEELQGIVSPGDGTIYVAGNSLGSGRLTRMSLVTGAPVIVGAQGFGNVYAIPFGLTIGPNGDLFGTSNSFFGSGISGAVRFSPDLQTVTSFARVSPPGMFDVYDTTFGPDGNLYLSVAGAIKRYHGPTGLPIGDFATGFGVGAIEFGADGLMYAAVPGQDRVIRFAADGTPLGTFITAGAGGIDNPSDIEFGPDGSLYVVGKLNRAIARFDPNNGAYLGTVVQLPTTGFRTPAFMTFIPEPGSAGLVVAALVMCQRKRRGGIR